MLDFALLSEILSAEREGFEPPVPLGTTVFKTVVIDHSTISPILLSKTVNVVDRGIEPLCQD